MLQLNSEQYIQLLYQMKLTRALEEKLVNLYREGKIFGGVYSSLGQEAISVGTTCALQEGDIVGPMIRNIGTMLIKGYTPYEIFCQYLAREDGPTGGKDTTLHFGDIRRGTVGTISIIGPLIPIMAGVALASRMDHKKLVTLTYIGDGGTSTGDFHEGLNFAAVHRLPFICVIENNQYAYSTPVSKQARVRDLAERAKGYGISGATVDGNNVLGVYEATQRAREICMEGNGPFLMECKTFRLRGHAEHDDPTKYVPKELFEEWKGKDPIDRYLVYLLNRRILMQRDLERMDEEIQFKLQDALEQALNAPFPTGDQAARGVFA